MKLKVIYRPSIPRDIRDEIRPLIDQYRGLLPPWLHTLAVIYYQDQDAEPSDDVKNHIANMTTDYEYRQARLCVCPRWRETKSAFKEYVIAHELAHVALAPMQTWTDSMLTNGVTDDAMRSVLEEGWRVAVESVTEDVSRAYVTLMKKL